MLPRMDYPITKWRWRVADKRRPGRTIVTRCYLTEPEAKALDPKAERYSEPMVITGPAAPHGTPPNR